MARFPTPTELPDDADECNAVRDAIIDGDLTTDDREQLTETALSLSLCPLHLCDYAICFDDENPECEAIRVIHPGHDS